MLLPRALPANFIPRRVYIDWDYTDLSTAPDFSQGYDEITAYVTDCSINIGNSDPESSIATIGNCTIHANNDTQIFSSENTSGIYYGKLIQDKPVKVDVYDMNTGTAYTIFRGKISNINPGTGINLKPQATFDCVDLLQDIQDFTLQGLFLQLNQTTDTLAKMIINAALNSPISIGLQLFKPTLSGLDTATITINGRIYTFTVTGSAPATIDKIAYGSSALGGLAAKALATVINVGDTNFDVTQGYAFGYASGQTVNPDVTAIANPDPIFQFGPSDVPTAFGVSIAYGQGSGGLFHNQDTILAGSAVLGYVVDTPGVQGTVFQTPAANGDSFQQSFVISYAATYNIRISGTGGPDCGKLDIYIDNVFNVTRDWYQVATSGILVQDISIALSAGTHTIKGIVNGKNASSSGFFVRLMNPASNTIILGTTVVNAIAITNGLVVLQARIKGNTSNIAVSTSSSSNITVSNLSGGVDLPSGLSTYQTGYQTITYAGDDWNDQNALSALTAVLNAEYGWLYVDRDGALNFKNSHSWFSAEDIVTADLTMNDQGYLVSPGVYKNDLKNRIRLKYTPRTLLASGVVAINNSEITIPGQSGSERWNGNVALPGGGSVTVNMKAVDPTTGQPMAIQSIITPLLKGVDYDVSDSQDGGSGANYNNSPSVRFSIVQNSDSIQVSIANKALGPLYIGAGSLHKLQVRGVGVVKYNPIFYIQDNASSQTLHGIKLRDIQIPLQIPDTFAQSLTQYLLDRWSTPVFNTRGIDFQDQRYVNGVFLPSLRLGSVIRVSESQTGVASKLFMIVGATYESEPGGVLKTKFVTRRMMNQFYWKLGNATYGKLGTTTRLGL